MSEKPSNRSYFVYLVRCKDKTLYTGWTNDLAKRVASHNSSDQGAKYTRARRPVTLVYSETYQSKQEAMQREAAIKKLSRAEKLAMIRHKP